jgi:hypothetical protein
METQKISGFLNQLLITKELLGSITIQNLEFYRFGCSSLSDAEKGVESYIQICRERGLKAHPVTYFSNEVTLLLFVCLLFIRYFLHLHFKCYPKSPLYSPPALLPNPPTPTS